MRGKATVYHSNIIFTRITPAYAGKRTFFSCPDTSFRDHPRLCGEKVEFLKTESEQKGSPPPMRGKAACLAPARSLARDHPRLCGEKTNSQTAGVRSLGSPPPMRGKGDFHISVCFIRRITPAYAGKSSVSCAAHQPRKDHPRLCGEKLFVCAFRFSLYGSPPPMRGKVLLENGSVYEIRITPAYAGKSE